MVEKNPLVSVFIVTYNSQDYIIDALESVKSQTYQNIELVVSDDCSSDDTLVIVKDWIKHNNIRFVRTEVVETPVNTGIPANYNRAVKACRGEWLKMMDGDDLLLDNCIFDNVDFINKTPNVQVVFSDMYKFEKNNTYKKNFNSKRKVFFNLDTRDQTIRLLKGNLLPSQTCFIFADLLKKNPYNEKYRLLEDYPMWLNLSCKGVKFYYFDKCTAVYRITDSVSSNKSELFSSQYMDIFKQFFFDVVLPLTKVYDAKGAYIYNRRFFLWYDLCSVFLKNKKNVFTVLISKLLRVFVFALARFDFRK